MPLTKLAKEVLEVVATRDVLLDRVTEKAAPRW